MSSVPVMSGVWFLPKIHDHVCAYSYVGLSTTEPKECTYLLEGSGLNLLHIPVYSIRRTTRLESLFPRRQNSTHCPLKTCRGRSRIRAAGGFSPHSGVKVVQRRVQDQHHFVRLSHNNAHLMGAWGNTRTASCRPTCRI